MMEELDEAFVQRHGKIQTPANFLLLCFLTLGLYAFWWNYKTWKFFEERENLDIYPVARAIFGVFYIHTLLQKVNSLAIEKGADSVNSSSNATLYIIIGIITRAISKFPEPYGVFALIIPFYAFLIPSVNQLNFFWIAEAPFTTRHTMSSGAIIAAIIGGILLTLTLIGLLM